MKIRLFLICLLFQPVLLLASGTDSHKLYDPLDKKKVDPKFEQGKAIFSGRDKSAAMIRYCVFHRGKLLKVKRSTVKQFRHKPIEHFESHVVDCKNPNQSAFDQLSDQHRQLVTYYLDKRFWLRLEGLNSSY